MDRDEYLQDTNERIHSSVRIRLACRGLGLNDKGIWDCSALEKWRLKRTKDKYVDPVPHHPGWEPTGPEEDLMEHPSECTKGRWIWEYAGNEKTAPKQRVMVEEPLGPYERYFLRLAGGEPNVYHFADTRDVHWRGGMVSGTTGAGK